jgi:hypothetical protein
LGALVIGGLFGCASVRAAPPDPHADTAQVAQEVFEDPEFWWKRTERVESSASWLERLLRAAADLIGKILHQLWNWLTWLLQGLFKVTVGDWSGGTPLVWLVAGLVLAWAAWKLYRHLEPWLRQVGTAANRTQAAGYQQLPEADVLFRQAGQAFREGRYAETVRLALLALIAQLQHRRLLRYDPTRTNREYQADLRAEPALATLFRDIALPYERVWYGRSPATLGDAERVLGLCRTVLAEEGDAA